MSHLNHPYEGHGSFTRVTHAQQIADRVVHNPEIISKNFQFIISTIHEVVLTINPMGRILVRWESFRSNLEILCHPIWNRLYHGAFIVIYVYRNVYIYIGMYMYIGTRLIGSMAWHGAFIERND